MDFLYQVRVVVPHSMVLILLQFPVPKINKSHENVKSIAQKQPLLHQPSTHLLQPPEKLFFGITFLPVFKIQSPAFLDEQC